MMGLNCASPDSCRSSPHSVCSLKKGARDSGGILLSTAAEDVLNVSPRAPPPSYHFNFNPSSISLLQLERAFTDRSSLCWESEKVPGFTCIASSSSNLTPKTKYSAELMEEIATLENEIMHLEHYLLSLYRTAFGQHLPSLPENNIAYSQYKKGSPLQVIADQSPYKIQPDIWKGGNSNHYETSLPGGFAGSVNPNHTGRKAPPARDQKNANPVHRSLGDHLGASFIDNALVTPVRLSEDIVKCISSIYCKLTNPTSTHLCSSVSSTSSFCSSSTCSPRNLSDSWSPHCNGKATGPGQIKGFCSENSPYAAMIEVLKICLDDDSFNYAARMLQKFRLLVKSLEKVDPRKMKREEKLAFWINLHNALVMHAYLACGAFNCVRSTSILKAAYNVGGYCINAFTIQTSILGIRSHYSETWLQSLLSPGKKFHAGSAKHVYAIEYPEPLVHFALCAGAYSDPAVRVYEAKNVFQDLKLAKEEFIRVSIYVYKERKVFFPKILYYFAKDMSLSLPRLLEVVNNCLSEVQQETITRCLKGRPDKFIHWLPQSSTFRYMIHRGLVEG